MFSADHSAKVVGEGDWRWGLSIRKKNCGIVLNADQPIAQSSERSHFSPCGSTMLGDYWFDYKYGFRGLFKYYPHSWLIGDAIHVLRNIRKYEGAHTQEGRLKVFIEEVGKWLAAVCEENLLIINGFYWNKHFYLIYLVGENEEDLCRLS